MKKARPKQILIIRVRAWHEKLILPQRLDFVMDLLNKNLNIKFMDIQPKRKLGYYLGYLFAFFLMFPRVLFDKSDVTILENPYLTIFTPLLKLRGKKVITEYVDYYPANLNRLKEKRFFRYLIAKVICKNLHIFSDIITTESETGKISLMNWGVPKKKIKILPVGINSGKIKYSELKRNKIRKKLDLGLDSIVIGYLGKFVDYYYLDQIVKSVSLLNKPQKSVSLLFIGDGPVRANLQDLCNKLSIKAKFTGNIKHGEVSGYYSAMDIFVFPLNSLAIKIGEILSIGLPLIVIRGMAEDWIQDGINGIVALDNSPEQLKKAIVRFLNLSSEEKANLRKNERIFALSYLSNKIIAKKYIELLV